MITQIFDMDTMFSYASQLLNSLSLPLAFIIGVSFAFFLLKGLLDLFRRFRGDY